MWLTLILRNWALLAITLLSVALLLSLSHGRMLKAERDEKIAVIESMRQEAQTYRDNSTKIAKEISDAHAQLLVATEKNAYANYQKRFGRGNAACGVRSNGLLPARADDHGQAGGAEGTDATGTESLAARPTGEGMDSAPIAGGCASAFVESCARDAGRLDLWVAWAVKNNLPVSKD